MSNQQLQCVKVLCVYGSPRAGGNTDVLLDGFVQGVADAGGQVDRVYLRELEISPCKEIYACRRDGKCAIQDDMIPLYEKLRECDAIVLSAPVMFYGVNAMAKAFIDRCQAFWCEKYVLKRDIGPKRRGKPRGVILSCGGTAGKRLFEGVGMTFRYFMDAIDAKPWGELFVRELDRIGDARRHPTAMDDARALGAKLVDACREGGDE